MKKIEFLTALLFVLLLSSSRIRADHEALAALISPHVLRLHILADSNRTEDQNIKMEVRSLILDTLCSSLSSDTTKQETIGWIQDNQSSIIAAVNQLLNRKGMSYRSHITITRDYFPDRIYASTLFPCGYYDAVRITLGSGKGHNWWCVLYPRLCLPEPVVPSKPCSPPSPNTKSDPDALSFFQKIHPDLILNKNYSNITQSESNP